MKMSASSVIAAAGFSLQQFTRAFIHNPGSCGTAIRSGARQALRSLTAASSSVGGYPRGGGGWVGGIQGGGGGANLYRRHQLGCRCGACTGRQFMCSTSNEDTTTTEESMAPDIVNGHENEGIVGKVGEGEVGEEQQGFSFGLNEEVPSRDVSPTEQQQPTEPIKLYVGNLGWETTSEDLQDAFRGYGNFEECFVVTDRATGESRGFGFVTFPNEEQANAAIDAMNGSALDGRTLKVSVSRPKGSYPPAVDNGCKVYIGNLGLDTTEETLRSELSKHGELVDITIVNDRVTGASRGFAFATYTQSSDASIAIEALNGAEVDGRELRVNVSRPRELRQRSTSFGGGGGGGGGGGSYRGGAPDNSKLFVGNLGWDTTSEDLLAAFSPYGDVIEAKVISDRETGNSRGFGFVTYSNDDSAEDAIQNLDGVELDGREIRVNVSTPKKPPSYQDSFDGGGW